MSCPKRQGPVVMGLDCGEATSGTAAFAIWRETGRCESWLASAAAMRRLPLSLCASRWLSWWSAARASGMVRKTCATFGRAVLGDHVRPATVTRSITSRSTCDACRAARGRMGQIDWKREA